MNTIDNTPNEQTAQQVVNEAPAPAPVRKAIRPSSPIEGFVFVGRSQNSGKSDRQRQITRYLHGLAVPGIGKGLNHDDGKRVSMARNRALLADSTSYDWFKELLTSNESLGILQDVGIRIEVTRLLGDNIAFVRPIVRTPELAVREWQAHSIRRHSELSKMLRVTDDRTLCDVFYHRACVLDSRLTLIRVVPSKFQGLAVTRGGYFVLLSGAERLRQHIGVAGTRGTIIDRDISITMRGQQLYKLEEVMAIMNDPDGYNVGI